MSQHNITDKKAVVIRDADFGIKKREQEMSRNEKHKRGGRVGRVPNPSVLKQQL